MTDDEDRTRVVSPNTIPVSGAVKNAAAQVEALDTAALAREPLDFDLTGGGEEPAANHDTLDFDLTGGHEIQTARSAMPLDLDLSTGETSIPEASNPVAPTSPSPVTAAPVTPISAASSAPTPAPSGGGIGKWIAIALALGAAILATVYLRK